MVLDLDLPKDSLVVVALSGGVDSSVCAGLLVEAGYRVVGISMRLYNAKGTQASSGGRCCGPKDLEDARAVCAYLNIPFYIVNYEEEFEKTVIDDFVKTYKEGRTPNPCVRCNQHIKFTPLLRRAKSLGASALCTGHFARLEKEQTTGRIRLLRGIDEKKDQSYFLFGMPRESLPYIRFPLGHLTKEEVREHAKRLGLITAEKPESQEICFVPDGNQAAFVKRKTGEAETEGEIINTQGNVVGMHPGVHHFTVGQRRGIGVGLGEKQYVVQIDALRKRVKVGSKEDLANPSTWVEEVCFLDTEARKGTSFSAHVQIRHRHKPKPARIEVHKDQRVLITFDSPEFGVAPGQAAVFYKGDEVIGGGMIAGMREDV